MQIAQRLAQRLGHKTVYGIDEQSDTINYSPSIKWRLTPGPSPAVALDRLQEKVEKMARAQEAAQKTTPIRLMLAQMNEPAKCCR